MTRECRRHRYGSGSRSSSSQWALWYCEHYHRRVPLLLPDQNTHRTKPHWDYVGMAIQNHKVDPMAITAVVHNHKSHRVADSCHSVETFRHTLCSQSLWFTYRSWIIRDEKKYIEFSFSRIRTWFDTPAEKEDEDSETLKESLEETRRH